MIDVKPQKNKNSVFLFEALKKILKSRDRRNAVGGSFPLIRWLLLEGSSRSGKTWSIISFLICLALSPEIFGKKKLIVRAYRYDATTTRDTIVQDFLEIMSNVFGGEGEDGKWVSLFDSGGTWNKTTQTYTFQNGSTFSFHGASNPQKLQGLKADISWFNEAMEITFDAKTQIEMRTTLFCIADWNPSETDHWIFDTVMGLEGEYLYCHSTYNDNYDLETGKSNLQPAQILAIEQLKPTPENISRGTANRFKWDVYGLGIRGVREGQVFDRANWDLVDWFPEQSVCQRWGYGQDFGYSQDPTTLIECALHNDSIFVREIVYERGLINCKHAEDPNIPSLQLRYEQNNISKTARIIGDSARKDLLDEMRIVGYNTQYAVKGAGSVMSGINLMKQFRIYILRSSQHIQKEFENYHFRKKPDGTFTDEPEDNNNHCIDAIRYWAMQNVTARIQYSDHQEIYRRPVRDSFDSF